MGRGRGERRGLAGALALALQASWPCAATGEAPALR